MTEDAARAEYDAVVALLEATHGARAGQMFGMPCIQAGRKTLAGYWRGAMVFKLPPSAHAEALALAGAERFDPGMGRPMREWVVVPPAHAARWPEFAQAAWGYVAGAA